MISWPSAVGRTAFAVVVVVVFVVAVAAVAAVGVVAVTGGFSTTFLCWCSFGTFPDCGDFNRQGDAV